MTSTREEPAKTFDDLFGGTSDDRNTSNSFVFNKDSDDESDGGGATTGVNVEELIGGSDNEEEIGLNWS